MPTVSLPEAEIPPCSCDASRIQQVCHILLHNAFSYAPAGSSVNLFISDIIGEREISIGVQDNSPCIPDEEKDKIFDRFYRINRSSSAGKEKGHHGLGPAVAKEIVAAHRGTLSVTDAKGGGSVFLIMLPTVSGTPFRTA